jgi:hypothetical protein
MDTNSKTTITTNRSLVLTLIFEIEKMFWICMGIVAIIIAIEHLLRWRDRKLARARTMRWLAFQINQEKKSIL